MKDKQSTFVSEGNLLKLQRMKTILKRKSSVNFYSLLKPEFYHCCPTLTITISIGYGGCHFGFADQVAERLA